LQLGENKMANEENKIATEKTVAPETATAESTASAGQQAPQPDPTALSIGDLKNLTTILDVASTRGAFKASEMAGVGYIYNKLMAFLAKVAPEGQQGGTATPTAMPTEGK
jgi:hypothetical protein|tara:strand:+ start:284 stop:613 length:330 start_codon:yes stop_codon:yes gene_type:complete